jgi:hypothetical protein
MGVVLVSRQDKDKVALDDGSGDDSVGTHDCWG